MGISIRLTRSGGLAGLEMVASVDVDELPPETARRVRSALAGLGRERAATGRAEPAYRPGPPQGADRFQYDLVVDTDGKRREITAHDGHLTPKLQALVDVLLPLARPQ